MADIDMSRLAEVPRERIAAALALADADCALAKAVDGGGSVPPGLLQARLDAIAVYRSALAPPKPLRTRAEVDAEIATNIRMAHGSGRFWVENPGGNVTEYVERLCAEPTRDDPPQPERMTEAIRAAVARLANPNECPRSSYLFETRMILEGALEPEVVRDEWSTRVQAPDHAPPTELERLQGPPRPEFEALRVALSQQEGESVEDYCERTQPEEPAADAPLTADLEVERLRADLEAVRQTSTENLASYHAAHQERERLRTAFEEIRAAVLRSDSDTSSLVPERACMRKIRAVLKRVETEQ